MNILDGYEKLKALGHTPSWAPPSAEHIARMRKLQEDHDARVRERHARHDSQIAAVKQYSQEKLTEHAMFKRLLREDQIDQRREQDRVLLATRQDYRDFLLQIRGSLDDKAQRELDDELTGTHDDSHNPDVRTVVVFLNNVWREAGIDVRTCASDAIANGAASRLGRWIEVPPVKNLRTAVIVLHETGHIVHPEVDDKREVLADDKFHKISVPQELAAWRWVLDRAPVWTDAMHADMTRFLGSYKRYAIETEVAAIDALCSRMSYLETRQRIAKEF